MTIHTYIHTYSRWTSSLPSCLWSLRIFPSLPGLRLTVFYRDASSALLQLVNQWLNFTLLTFPRFLLRKKEPKSYFGKNRTHDFLSSRCAGYLLDHSGDDIFSWDIANDQGGGQVLYTVVLLLLLLLFPHISPISRTRGHRVQGAYHPYPN